MKTVSEYADAVMVDIDDCIAEGVIPTGLTTYSELHNYVDANDFLIDAEVPFGKAIATDDDPDGVAMVNAVTDEVQSRLRARSV